MRVVATLSSPALLILLPYGEGEESVVDITGGVIKRTKGEWVTQWGGVAVEGGQVLIGDYVAGKWNGKVSVKIETLEEIIVYPAPKAYVDDGVNLSSPPSQPFVAIKIPPH